MMSDAMLDALDTATPADASNLRAVADYMDGRWPSVLTDEMRAARITLAAKLWVLADALDTITREDVDGLLAEANTVPTVQQHAFLTVLAKKLAVLLPAPPRA